MKLSVFWKVWIALASIGVAWSILIALACAALTTDNQAVWRATPWSLTYGPAPVVPPESSMETVPNPCMRGPDIGVYTRDICGASPCGAYDLDNDGDVDIADVAIAQVRYGR